MGALALMARREIRAIDGEVPVSDVSTLDEVLDESARSRRWTMALLAAFAGLALLLAAVGIYGVMAWMVSQRTREIGIRMALGAQTRDVFQLIGGEGFVLVLAGIGMGLAGALALTRLMSSLLFGVSPTDAATFAAVPAVLGAVALLACYLPARRAARVDPTVALRCD